uniref:Uncharacterized protein n=1 Tax=Cacopsylla melanoneura TaxID=428564 RepID=A0A8D9F2A2_9HEMI
MKWYERDGRDGGWKRYLTLSGGIKYERRDICYPRRTTVVDTAPLWHAGTTATLPVEEFDETGQDVLKVRVLIIGSISSTPWRHLSLVSPTCISSMSTPMSI